MMLSDVNSTLLQAAECFIIKLLTAKEGTMKITEEIRESLLKNQDLKYREFQAKLMPTVDKEKIIGVRTPVLRKLAKEFEKHEDIEKFLELLPHDYYEENNLHGMIIERYKDFCQCVEAIEKFLPYVDNWATCDLLSPKVFRKNKKELLPLIKKWMASDHTYTIRFGIEMLMSHYLEEDFQPEFLDMVAVIRSEEYYIKMIQAWFFATALAKQYESALPYIEKQAMDKWTHNKSIQKAIESYRITPEQKVYLRSLKVK